MKKILFLAALLMSCVIVCNAETSLTASTAAPQGVAISENPYAWLSVYRISSSDLNGYSNADLRLMRNAIYARHGYIFKSNDLYSYFRMFSWYNPRYSNVESRLNSVEKANVMTIKNCERGTSYGSINSSNPFAFLSSVILSRSDLMALDSQELAILRNAIYARHGYIFKKSYYYNFFSSFSWYSPRYTNVDNMLNSVEKANVATIKSMER